MIFNALWDAAQRGELLLIDGALCHYHLRRDGQLTIRDLIVLPERQGQGLGTLILHRLAATPGATSIVARCPVDLAANAWYAAHGFAHTATTTTRTQRRIVTWTHPL